MYDAGLAERLHDHIGGMFEMELTTMFGGYGFLMNGHMCVFIWGDRLLSGLVRLRQTQLPTSRMLVRWM
mgnify:FL=1